MKHTKMILVCLVLIFIALIWVRPIEILAQSIAPQVTTEVTEAPNQVVSTRMDEALQDNIAIWFLGATIGLLLIIIIAQAWPKTEEGENQN